jgi:hypothetical protein
MGIVPEPLFGSNIVTLLRQPAPCSRNRNATLTAGLYRQVACQLVPYLASYRVPGAHSFM